MGSEKFQPAQGCHMDTCEHEESRKVVRMSHEFTLQKEADVLRNARSGFEEDEYVAARHSTESGE